MGDKPSTSYNVPVDLSSVYDPNLLTLPDTKISRCIKLKNFGEVMR